MALSGALALAQTQSVARVAVQAGNGQAACQCINTVLQTFQPISVKATDNRGNPVPGATITWAVTSGQITLGSNQATTATTVTDNNGISTIPIALVVQSNVTSPAVPYLVNVIQAAANNNSVFFTELESLRTTQGSSVIQASGNPTFNGADLSQATLSAPVGSTLFTPIQMQVTSGSPGAGVANVAVRIVNNQSSPALSCAYYGGYADPGSVLTDLSGNSSCYPVFNGSGTGKFYITVGGVPASNFASASYLQDFGPYTFTSIPGAAAAMQMVSGNNQVGAQGQALNPLVAQLVDANGYAVQNQTVTWAVTPAGAAALANAQTVTDNNGEVSAGASLYPPAASGALITVALASNAAISVAFQETLSGSVSSLTKVSGDGQSAQPGASFFQPLVVQVNGPSGPVANYPVQFQISGPVSLPGGSTGATNANGQVALTVKAGVLTGTATVTAVAGALSQTFTLTITSASSATPNGLTMVIGSGQSAILNTMFALPLVVQVNSAAGPVAGYVVSFSATGPIAISSAAATTGSNGQAQITVQAGATAGAATVTASVSVYSVTFNLTVTPAGPAITANSFLNAASRVAGSISPCSLAILSAPGLTPDGTSDLSMAPLFGRLPHSIHGLSVTFGGVPAPIVSVAMGATNPEVTLQVPCEVAPGPSVPVTVKVGGGSTTLNIPVQAVSPGIFQMAMSDGVVRAVLVRDDGSFADIGGTDVWDPENPARRGENVRIYATGLGSTLPLVFTDDIQNPNADLIGFDATVASVVQAGIVGFGGLQVISARQAPDLIGIYEVQVLLPAGAPTGNSVPIAISVVPIGANSAVSSNVSLIPIQ